MSGLALGGGPRCGSGGLDPASGPERVAQRLFEPGIRRGRCPPVTARPVVTRHETRQARRHGGDGAGEDAELDRQLTIGMPVYNGAKYVAEAVESILTQTFTDFELIISDNASTDHTESMGRALAVQDPG